MTRLTLAAIRFTDDLPAMRRFLETLGLAATSTRGEDWAVLAAGQGQVWLHSAKTADNGSTAGVTDLTGEVENLDAYAQQLKQHDLDGSLVDEAYARVLEVQDPLGRRLGVHDRGDRYGYTQHEANPDPGVSLSVCRFTDPQGPYATFAEALGLTREGEPNPWYVPYSTGTGTLGLHHDDGSHALPDNRVGPTVTLGFTTTVPLEEIRQRLHEGGYPASEIIREGSGSRVETVDPDGCHLEIHAAA